LDCSGAPALAADELQAAGQQPTLEAIRQKVGGSYTTLAPLLREWKAAQSRVDEAPLPGEPVPESIAARMAESGREVRRGGGRPTCRPDHRARRGHGRGGPASAPSCARGAGRGAACLHALRARASSLLLARRRSDPLRPIIAMRAVGATGGLSQTGC
jgi:hypothetical protein